MFLPVSSADLTVPVVLLLQYGSGMLIVKPEESEGDKVKETVISRVIKAKQMERNPNADGPKPSDGIEAEIKKRQENDFDQQVEEQIDGHSAMIYKQSHFFVVCVMLSLMFLVLVEFSYTAVFKDNVVLFLVILMFCSIALEYILINFVLDEALLVQPILGYASFTLSSLHVERSSFAIL